MSPLVYTLFFHLLGFALISTSLLGGWMLNLQYKKATGWDRKSAVAKMGKSIGLLSPFGTALLLLSGVGNMVVDGLGLFTAAWLTAKLILVVLLIVAGGLSGVMAGRRMALLDRLREGKSPTEDEASLTALDRQQQFLYLLNSCLVLIIVALSVAKPG